MMRKLFRFMHWVIVWVTYRNALIDFGPLSAADELFIRLGYGGN